MAADPQVQLDRARTKIAKLELELLGARLVIKTHREKGKS